MSIQILTFRRTFTHKILLFYFVLLYFNIKFTYFKCQNVRQPGVVTTQYSQWNPILVYPSSTAGFVGKYFPVLN